MSSGFDSVESWPQLVRFHQSHCCYCRWNKSVLWGRQWCASEWNPTGFGHEKHSSAGNLVLVSFSRLTVVSLLVRIHPFIYYNEAFCVRVFQDSTLCPLIHQQTTIPSISTVPAGHWWQSVLLWKTLLRIVRRGREPACLQVLPTNSITAAGLNPHRFALSRSILNADACNVNGEKLWYRN